MFRHLMRRPGVQAAACWLIARYIQLVWRTGRWTIIGDEAPRALKNAGTPFIAAFWHGRLLMTPYALGGESANVRVLISTHRDGRIISRAMQYFNIDTISGSSSRGGAGAFRRAARFLRHAGVLGITPDGPRGPRMRASAGVVTGRAARPRPRPRPTPKAPARNFLRFHIEAFSTSETAE